MATTWSEVPDEIVLSIFQFTRGSGLVSFSLAQTGWAAARDILTLAGVCARWRRLAKDVSLWADRLYVGTAAPELLEQGFPATLDLRTLETVMNQAGAGVGEEQRAAWTRLSRLPVARCVIGNLGDALNHGARLTWLRLGARDWDELAAGNLLADEGSALARCLVDLNRVELSRIDQAIGALLPPFLASKVTTLAAEGCGDVTGLLESLPRLSSLILPITRLPTRLPVTLTALHMNLSNEFDVNNWRRATTTPLLSLRSFILHINRPSNVSMMLFAETMPKLEALTLLSHGHGLILTEIPFPRLRRLTLVGALKIPSVDIRDPRTLHPLTCLSLHGYCQVSRDMNVHTVEVGGAAFMPPVDVFMPHDWWGLFSHIPRSARVLLLLQNEVEELVGEATPEEFKKIAAAVREGSVLERDAAAVADANAGREPLEAAPEHWQLSRITARRGTHPKVPRFVYDLALVRELR